MIFNHEYLVTEDERKVYDLDRLHEKRREACAYELGKKIIEVLEWKAVEQSKHLDPYTERYKLEIITFHMDKWVEFKNKLRQYIINCEDEDILPDSLDVIKMFQELESFGKPSGDAI